MLEFICQLPAAIRESVLFVCFVLFFNFQSPFLDKGHLLTGSRFALSHHQNPLTTWLSGEHGLLLHFG